MKDIYLTSLYNSGLFSETDIHFAGFILGLSKSKNNAVTLGAALVSSAAGKGDVCINLARAFDTIQSDKQADDCRIPCTDYQEWIERLRASDVVGSPGEFKPMILDVGKRLYLYRHWEYETKLFESIRQRSSGISSGIDKSLLADSLTRLFPDHGSKDPDLQKIALLSVLIHNFCVISGGPGTGKTTAVTRIIATLLEQADKTAPRILLAAPTGKAASRLTESIKKNVKTIHCSECIKNSIPTDASTIHRLLKPIPGSPYFKYNAENLLPADLVIIDEVSMADVALMSKLFQAIPLDAKIILLGDKDQLASVEAGSVLGDICGSDAIDAFSIDFCKKIEELTDRKFPILTTDALKRKGLSDNVVVLTKNYRFVENSGIEKLSRAVKSGNAPKALALLGDPECPEIGWESNFLQEGIKKLLHDEILNAYKGCFAVDHPREALAYLNRFQILCAVNTGRWGVFEINRFAEQVLEQEHLIPGGQKWYKGMPIMITRNNYDLDLYNGDTGIIMPDPGSKQKDLYAFFPDGTGGLKQISPYRLPDHEKTYAITIHKSQGSEFERTFILLPDRDYPLLTRELIYTGLTRASETVKIAGNETVFSKAIHRKTERISGLREMLWGVEK